MNYTALQSLLFRLQPETAHHLSLRGLDLADAAGLSQLLWPRVEAPVTVMGLTFPNAVGLAAGLDKNGEHIDGLAALGFGFIEIGTVTPRPQPGNPKPRLFRLPEQRAIINRMGFNNKGVDYLLRQVDASRFDGVLGINIGKNFDTPVERANDDYLYCLRKVYSRASYVTVNVSSPNTPGLRSLQFGESLTSLLAALKSEQARLADTHGRYVPVTVKIAPDMTDEEVVLVADALKAQRIDGVIATNTTLSREEVKGSPLADEAGGLSGEPVRAKSTHVVTQLANALQGELPIVGVGGISNGSSAREKIAAGASLVQVYSGFIYQGPKLIGEAARAIAGRTDCC